MRWRVRKLRALDVARTAHPRGAPHLGAASALVEVGGRFHAIADDEHHLAIFSRREDEPVELLRLFAGRLPDGKKARKKVKPDLECLVGVRAADGRTLLVAFGSGSRPNRERGARLVLDTAGAPVGRVRRLDLAPLYAPLRSTFAELNIEGAFVVGDELRLLQRATGKDPRNACIAYEWPAIARWLDGAGPAPKPRSVTEYALGTIDGVPWAFSDGAALRDGRWAFTAVAEASGDSYADAPHRGSAIGIVSRLGKLVSLDRVSRQWKVEGLTPARSARRAEGEAFFLVTDADDPGRASCLLRASRIGR